MALPSYVPPTKAISIKGSAEDLVVHGLSFADITALVQQHLPEITEAVEKYRDSMSDVYTRASMDGFLSIMLSGFPDLASHIIARAADDASAFEQVRKYPTGVQIAALVGIAELTLDDMGSLTDPSPALASLVRAAMGSLTHRTIQSLASTGLSDEQSGA